jgi:hypothetical protein
MKKKVAENRLRRLVAAGKGDSSEASALKFSVEVTTHDSREVVMVMNFANPGEISSGN